MTPTRPAIEAALARLVSGMTGLSADGRFHEPNLDGTPGDYVSFESWEWPQGVGLHGLVRLWRRTRDPALLALIEGWYDRRIAAGLPALNVNTTAPLLALSELWREQRQARFEPVLRAQAEAVLATLVRADEGGFQHDVSDRLNPGELWDDTLFMVALFLASWGQAGGEARFTQEAERQFLVHARYLADPVSGLWFHGWTFEGRHNFARARWGRGNAWIALAIPTLVEIGGTAPAVRDHLTGVWQTLLEALLPLQTASGAWRTLLDDPTSYEEMSATAGFAAALLAAARLGLGPPACAEAGRRGLTAVLDAIGEDGVLQGVSYGTRMGHDLQFYRDIPIQPTAYGQALAMLCLVEALESSA